MRAHLAVSGLALLGLAAAGCAQDPLVRASEPVFSATPAAYSPDVRADGWVWESYRDLEVAVPPGWAHGTGDVAAAQWCISDTTYATPFIVRPGIAAEATCPGPAPGEPDPSTVIEKAGTFVSFARAAAFPGVPLGAEGDRVTTIIGTVLLRIQAPTEVRERILNSARRIDIDAVNCPVTDPIAAEPMRRPTPARALAELREVSAIAACRYLLDPLAGPQASLYSSVEVRGPAAAAATQALAQAPPGTGPDDLAGCPTPDGFGKEAIVLRILSDSGVSQVYLRYGGCNFLDDGLTLRKLTRAAVAPFVSGPNAIAAFGAALTDILDDPDAPATSGDPGAGA